MALTFYQSRPNPAIYSLFFRDTARGYDGTRGSRGRGGTARGRSRPVIVDRVPGEQLPAEEGDPEHGHEQLPRAIVGELDAQGEIERVEDQGRAVMVVVFILVLPLEQLGPAQEKNESQSRARSRVFFLGIF